MTRCNGNQDISRSAAENLTDKQPARIERAFAARAEREVVDLARQCAQLVRAAYKQVGKAEGRGVSERTCPRSPPARCPRPPAWAGHYAIGREAFLASFDAGVTNGGPEAINGLIEHHRGGPEAINGLIELHCRIARVWRTLRTTTCAHS